MKNKLPKLACAIAIDKKRGFYMNANDLQKLTGEELEALLHHSMIHNDYQGHESQRRAIFHEQARRRLVASAARATELFSEDELEAFAENQRHVDEAEALAIAKEKAQIGGS